MTEGVERINDLLSVQGGRFLKHRFDQKLERGDIRVFIVDELKHWREVDYAHVYGDQLQLHVRYPVAQHDQDSAGTAHVHLIKYVPLDTWLAIVPNVTNRRVDAMGRLIPP